MVDKDILLWAVGRASHDLQFLGYDLREYRELNDLDDDGVARFLQCSRESLDRLALCLHPDPNRGSFRADIEQTAFHCNAHPQRLAQLIRAVDAVRTMRSAPQLRIPQAEPIAYLMAARDRRAKPSRKSKTMPKTQPKPKQHG